MRTQYNQIMLYLRSNDLFGAFQSAYSCIGHIIVVKLHWLQLIMT